MNTKRFRFAQNFFVLISCVAVLGCSQKPAANPSTSTVYGSATIDDKPITGGMISIVSDENPRKRATGILRPDGTFRLAGSPIGKSHVVIDTTSVLAGDRSAYVPLPRKYGRLETTDLTVDLLPGDNKGVDFKLVGGK